MIYPTFDEDFFVQSVVNWLNNDSGFITEHVLKKKRKRSRKYDFWETGWGKNLRDPEIQRSGTQLGRKFRRRFRVPFPVFEHIVHQCKLVNLFGTIHEGKVRIPIEFKVLISLRILGRGNCFDDVEEFSNIPESTIHSIFHQFVHAFVHHFYDIYVTPPTGDRLFKVKSMYEQLGLPGCKGSMDCTHLPWDKCPESLKILCTGKEGEPTIAFNCIVDHTRLIHYCSEAFVGSANDQTISHNDSHTMAYANDEYADEVFYILLEDGSLQKCEGGWLLVDGGYPKLSCYIDGCKDRISHEQVLWGEWMESVRKDVECTFGILKQRFRILKNPIQYHDHNFIENIMRSCCIIHNMLLLYDGISIDDWEGNVNWTTLHPDANVNELQQNDIEYALGGAQVGTLSLVGSHSGMDYVAFENSMSPPLYADLTNVSQQPVLKFSAKSSNDYQALRNALITSFKVQYIHGLLRWPKTFNSSKRVMYPVAPYALTRARGECHRALYVQPSTYRAKDPSTELYTVTIGDGLFSRILYKKDDIIAKFKGEVIDEAEYNRRKADGKGGYCILLSADNYLDCYENCKSKICLASFANSAYRCWNTQTNVEAVNNAYLSVCTRNNTAVLKALHTIPAFVEISWNYGPSYYFLREV